jgi:hypothetical protein
MRELCRVTEPIDDDSDWDQADLSFRLRVFAKVIQPARPDIPIRGQKRKETRCLRYLQGKTSWTAQTIEAKSLETSA